MPLYDVECEICGHQQEIYRSLANFDDLPECCGVRMTRLIVAPMIMSDIAPYRSQITGEIISSRSQHRAHLKEHGCIEIGNEKQTTQKPKDAFGAGLKQELAERLDTYRSK